MDYRQLGAHPPDSLADADFLVVPPELCRVRSERRRRPRSAPCGWNRANIAAVIPLESAEALNDRTER